MKLSNKVFLGLLAVLFIAPFIIMGIFYFHPKEVKLAGLEHKHHTIVIENPDLSKNDVQIEHIVYDKIPNEFKINDKSTFKDYTSIHYQGKKNYLPIIREENNTLYIGKPEKPTQGEKLTLHIRSAFLKKIILNNEEIWNNPDESTLDGFSYVPSLTEKLNAFVENSVLMQKELKAPV